MRRGVTRVATMRAMLTAVAASAAVAAMVTGVACGPKVAKTPPPPAAPLTPAQIAEKALPSVVMIETMVAEGRGLGTGFVVWQDGRIATNYHVIAGASAAVVTLPDKRTFHNIEVMSVDPKRDLAIIRIQAHDLPALTLGDSDKVRAGEAVVAIGNPHGLGDTVSNGLISGLREIDAERSLLQISAPISGGSSGGPLFNDRGEVIGVAVGFFEDGQNLSFGVPVNYLKPMLIDELREPIAQFGARTRQRTPPNNGNLPKVQRNVPNHPLALLDDCPADQLEVIVQDLDKAISIGAPLYNKGDFTGCFQVYEGAALRLDRALKACSGAKTALSTGITNAGALQSDFEKAWAMRDAFDGLLDVILRKLKP